MDSNQAGYKNWKHAAKEDFKWVKRFIQRVEGQLTLEISSSHTGCTTADVLVKIHHTTMDKLWCWFDQAIPWALGGFQDYERPWWLNDTEWHDLIQVMDLRFADQASLPRMSEDTRLIKGTGFVGLCEFDLEEAVRLWLRTKGVRINVTYTSAPELQIV